jgi:tetraacyldisaccharide 4'-kinase
MLAEPEHGPGRVFAFNGQLHAKIADINSQEGAGLKEIPRPRAEILRAPLRGAAGMGRLAAQMRMTPREWREAIETPYLEIILEQRRGKGAALLRSLLFAASKSYQFVYMIYRFCIKARLMRDSTLGIQVIAIGNLTYGGTGKTPVVEKFARELQRQGRTVAILTRGYRSRPQPLSETLLNKLLLREDSTPPRVVSDGKNLLLDSDTAGDEPYMLASNLKDVVVLVDKNRVKSGRYAIEHYGCDTLLLDDGFQYWRLAGRRQDVVLVDCQQPFGNEHMIPRGTLREPPSALARANVISSPRATARPRRCASASIVTIRPPASSSASTPRSLSRTFSRAKERALILSRICGWPA